MDNRVLSRLLVSVAALLSVAQVPATARDDDDTLPGRWPTYNNAYDGQRVSPARSITPENVAILKRIICEARGGVLCQSRCLLPRRAYLPRHERRANLRAGRPDGRAAVACDPLKGESFSSAPIAWKGLVFIGAAGGDWDIRGYVLALDAETGREKRRFYTIPMGSEPGADSWKLPETAAHGDAAMWTSYTLDTTTGEPFVPTGNPAPDYARDPGANLYTDSLVVLDAMTGKLKWYHQFKSNDGLDYDFGVAPALYTSKHGNKLLAAGSKDGYLYGIDRATHGAVFKTPVTTIKNADARPTPAGVLVCPGPLGGVERNGPAVNPVSLEEYHDHN